AHDACAAFGEVGGQDVEVASVAPHARWLHTIPRGYADQILAIDVDAAQVWGRLRVHPGASSVHTNRVVRSHSGEDPSGDEHLSAPSPAGRDLVRAASPLSRRTRAIVSASSVSDAGFCRTSSAPEARARTSTSAPR